MSCQLAICARVVKTGNIAPVLNYGLTLDDFTQTEAKNFWNLILTYFLQQETAGAVLDKNVLQAWLPTLVVSDDYPGMSLEALCYEVRRQRIVTMANEAAVKCAELIMVPTQNPTVPLAILHKNISDLIALGTAANTDVTLKQGITGIMRKIELARRGENFAVANWPWAVLNNVTFGLQPDDYVIFYGRPKSMKSWVLAYLLSWFFNENKKVLVYTKEMTPDNVYMRAIACICKLAYSNLREATSPIGKQLTPEEEFRLIELEDNIGSDPYYSDRLTVLSGRDVPAGGDNVAWLNSKIDQYKPELLVVDGLYLLKDQNKAQSDHVRVMNISRDLRQMNLHTGVPIIATMQANRKAAGHNDANLDEIAYSDALAQDATIAARVINDKVSPTISIVIGGSREFKLHGFRINAVPAVDFSYHSTLTEKDIEKAKEGDVSEVEEKNGKAKSKDKETVRAPNRTPKTNTDNHVNVDSQINTALKNLA
jgi:replicative DNA helicase